ncbi:hypothetical protein CYMTET_52589, partial [Cymbomonas tetramitiformis]
NILFRQWARMWDLEKPVLLEKSPPNMMWMRFLQGMFPTASRFVVITRHPLAVSLAHRKWECCTGMSLTQLVEHWLVQHELMQVRAPPEGGPSAARSGRANRSVHGDVALIYISLVIGPL